MTWSHYQQDGTLKTAGDGIPPAGVVFEAQKTSGTLADNAVVVFDTRVADPYGWFDTSTGRFTPKIAGYYDLAWSVGAGAAMAADAVWYSTLRKNGTAVAGGSASFQRGGTYGLTTAGSGQIYLNGTSDYVEVLLNQSNGSAVTANNVITRFAGELIGVAAGVIPEPWHIVGATGEPPFVGTWVNLDAAGAGQRYARFYKDPYGMVWLSGVVKLGTMNTDVFVLPAGYRPIYERDYAVNSNGAFGNVAVLAAGNVRPNIGNNAYVFLDGVNFRAEQ